MDVLRKQLIHGSDDVAFGQFKIMAKKPDGSASTQKTNRNTLLQAVSSYLIKTYRETASCEDKISAEEIHFNVNRSETISENVSFITASRLVKSTFKNAHYDKDTKMFHGLERVFPAGELMKERSVKYTQPRWSASLLSMLCQLYENHMLCDAYIKCKNKAGGTAYIPCHSCVLAASSHVLLSNFTEKRMILKDCNKLSVECDGISLEEWNTVLQFMYKGNVDICLKNVFRLWSVGRFLRIQGLTVLLENMMKSNSVIVPAKWKNQCHDQGHIYVKPYEEDPADSFHTPSFFDTTQTSADSMSDFHHESVDVKPEIEDHYRDEFRAVHLGLPADSLRNIAEQVISSYGKEQSEEENVTTEESCQNHDESEPKSKRRKMYKPRKVAQNEGCEAPDTVKIEPCSTEKFDEENGRELGTLTENIGNLKKSADTNSVLKDTIIGGIKMETSFDSSESNPHESSGVYIDTAEEGNFYSLPKPVVIAPIENNETRQTDEGDNSNRSMLYGLLNSEKPAESDTPMLKSLLASRAVATQSPNLGLSQNFQDIRQTDSEGEMLEQRDSNKTIDPDYKPVGKTKRKRAGAVPKKCAEMRRTGQREPLPHKVQNVFTWSEEDLNRERQKLGSDMDSAFSASSLLLSMINKATPTENEDANPSSQQKKNSSEENPRRTRYANRSDTSPSSQRKQKSNNENPRKSFPKKQTERSSENNINDKTVPISASHILANLLENRKEPNLNSNNSLTESHQSPGGLLFSQVLQGMASAYSSPIGNKTSADSPTLLSSLLSTPPEVNNEQKPSELASPVEGSKSKRNAHKSKKSAKERDLTKSDLPTGLKIALKKYGKDSWLRLNKSGKDYSVKTKPGEDKDMPNQNADEQGSSNGTTMDSGEAEKNTCDSDAEQIRDTTRILMDLATSRHASSSLHNAGTENESPVLSLSPKNATQKEDGSGSPASNTSEVDNVVDNISKSWSHLQALLSTDRQSGTAKQKRNVDIVAGGSQVKAQDSGTENETSNSVSVCGRSEQAIKNQQHSVGEGSESGSEAPCETNEPVPMLDTVEVISNHSQQDQINSDLQYAPVSDRKTMRDLLKPPEEEEERDKQWKAYLDRIMKNAPMS